ncbi:MAG: hypothetical protein FWH48_11105, partial [Oscillospiraceae bacterium]|nr:hypothetical protein [Oscillospiraceae bacterium]
PDVLDGRCKIENGELILENKENRESYKIAIIPAMETISISNLKKLRQFASSGGTLICAGRLPSKSAERGGDADVCRIVSELLSCKNSFGRNFCHIPDFSTEKLSAALKDTGIIFDVECEPISVSGGNFTYIHKIKENCDIYFFANSSDEAVCANVRLCGEKTLERWDPHTAKRKKAEYNFGPDGTTSLIVELEPIKSAFFVAQNC